MQHSLYGEDAEQDIYFKTEVKQKKEAAVKKDLGQEDACQQDLVYETIT